jgi:hypothetical protein
VLVYTVPEHVFQTLHVGQGFATMFILWFGRGVFLSQLCPHRVCNPLSLPPRDYQEHLTISLTHYTCISLGLLSCGYQDLFTASVCHLAPYPVDTKISSLHLYLTWPPILWIPRSLHYIHMSLGLLSCGYQDLFTAFICHLASYPVDTKISSLHLYLTWPPILWIPRCLHYICISLGLLSCGYKDLFHTSVSHLASHPVDIRSCQLAL